MSLLRWFLIAVGTCSWLAAAQAPIEPHFSALPGFRMVRQKHVAGTEQAERVGSYRSPVLTEYGLTSYSVWEAVPTAGKGQSASVEVYELRDSTAAFGLFSIWDESEGRAPGRRLDLPQDNRYDGENLVFWRGSRFFRLQQEGQPENRESEMTALARAIIHALPGAQELPVSVVHLPEQEIEAGTVHFYLGKESLALNKDFPKPLHTVVGMEDDIEISSAQYAPNHTPLFLIAYPTPKLASQYFLKVQTALSSHFSQKGVYITKSGVLIGLCIGSEQDANRILGRVKYTPSVQWLDEKPDPNASGMRFIVRAILGTAVFLMITLGMGIVVGYVRYQVIRRFPNLGKKDEMVRLKISGP